MPTSKLRRRPGNSTSRWTVEDCTGAEAVAAVEQLPVSPSTTSLPVARGALLTGGSNNLLRDEPEVAHAGDEADISPSCLRVVQRMSMYISDAIAEEGQVSLYITSGGGMWEVLGAGSPPS